MQRLTMIVLAIAITAAAPAPTPVVLAPQPGGALDRAARTLTRADLAEARAAGERPLVLVGSARLSPKDRPALFVQLQSPRECGSAGCNTSVWLWRDGNWARVLDGVSGTVALAPSRTRGMADLVTEKARYTWDGAAYQDVRPAPNPDLRPRR